MFDIFSNACYSQTVINLNLELAFVMSHSFFLND